MPGLNAAPCGCWSVAPEMHDSEHLTEACSISPKVGRRMRTVFLARLSCFRQSGSTLVSVRISPVDACLTLGHNFHAFDLMATGVTSLMSLQKVSHERLKLRSRRDGCCHHAEKLKPSKDR